jgi:putative intracellular protease/amidase
VHAQIVLFDGFDPLDVIAPFEVLAAGSDEVGGDLEVELVSAQGPRPVVSGTRGMVLNATAGLDPAKSGYVIVPGASGPIDGDPDEVDTIPVLLARFGETAAVPLMRQAIANPDVTVATVCGGSLALAMAETRSPTTSAWTYWTPPASTSSTPGLSTTVIWSRRVG